MEDDTCSGCGNDLNVTLLHKEPYDVDETVVCYGCRAKAMMQRLDSHQHEQEDKKLDEQKAWASPRYADGRMYLVEPIRVGQGQKES